MLITSGSQRVRWFFFPFKTGGLPFNSQDLIVNSPLQLLLISLLISQENLVLDQDNNFYLIHLSILITCLLNNEWIIQGEFTCYALLGVKGLNDLKQMPVDGSFNNINPLHPNFSMHILLTVLYNSYGTDKENLFNNQELHKLVIILFILMAWTCNSEVIL